MESPIDSATVENLKEATREVLAGLTAREAKVLRMRFGIDMNTDHTLEEVGKQFDVTRERIRQIEAKALRKLRHPTRSDHLRSFLDDLVDSSARTPGTRRAFLFPDPARYALFCTQRFDFAYSASYAPRTGDNNNKRTQPCRSMCSPAISPGSDSSPVFLPWVPVSVEAGVVGAAAPSRRPVSAPPSNAPPTVSRTSPPTTMRVLATVTAMSSPRTISACWPTPSLPTVASARSISALMPRLPWPVPSARRRTWRPTSSSASSSTTRRSPGSGMTRTRMCAIW